MSDVVKKRHGHPGGCFSNERGAAPSKCEELDRNTLPVIMEARIIDRCKIWTKTKRVYYLFRKFRRHIIV